MGSTPSRQAYAHSSNTVKQPLHEREGSNNEGFVAAAREERAKEGEHCPLSRKRRKKKGEPIPKELEQFFNEMEQSIRRKQLTKSPLKVSSEIHEWHNFIGGSLNSISRAHKPHHTFIATPSINVEVIRSHMKHRGILPAKLPFTRRNSTGSVDILLTIDDLDIEGMIKVTALVLHFHIIQGSRQNWHISPTFNVFDDAGISGTPYGAAMPSYDQVYYFYNYVYKTAQLEKDCVVASLVYIDRLLTETAGKLRICERNWRSIILSSMVLASKVWDDLSMWNLDFSKVGRVTLRAINDLEVAILQALQYNVSVASSTFARYFFHLRDWCIILGNSIDPLTASCGPKRRHSHREALLQHREALYSIGGTGVTSSAQERKANLNLQRKSTLCSSRFSSVYERMLPCLEELVDVTQRDAGGRSQCTADLKRHETQSSIALTLRERKKWAIIQNLILNEIEDVSTIYELQPGKVLGVGISGVVQVVKHKRTGVEYAMKTLHLDRLENFKKLDELRNEIEIMSALNHPNIVRLLELYESPSRDTVSLIMELCTGGELLSRLNVHGAYSDRECADMVKKMLSAVRHCHQYGICHRDLKLENWVFENDAPTAELKLIDFGLSRHFGEDEEVLHVPVGTPYTIAPEVLEGKYSFACDLWSLGVLTFMLLTGTALFTGNDDYQVLAAVKEAEWRWPAHVTVSKLAKDFVGRLLVLDPKQRLTADQALAHPWLQRQTEDAPAPTEKTLQIIESLRRFGQLGTIKKLILQTIAFTTEPRQVEDLRREFQVIDSRCNGLITLDDLRAGLQRVAVESDVSEHKALINAVGMDHGDVIRYNDFLAAGLLSLGPTLLTCEPVLRGVFDKFDRKHTGWISSSAFALALGKPIKQSEAQDFFDGYGECNSKGEWRVNFEGFCNIMRSTCMPRSDSSTSLSSGRYRKPKSPDRQFASPDRPMQSLAEGAGGLSVE